MKLNRNRIIENFITGVLVMVVGAALLSFSELSNRTTILEEAVKTLINDVSIIKADVKELLKKG